MKQITLAAAVDQGSGFEKYRKPKRRDAFLAEMQTLVPWDALVTLIELLGMPKTAAEFLEPLLANLAAGVAAVEEAQSRGKVEIGADAMLHLPAITAMADRGEPARTRETIYNLIGNVQFPDMLLELDAATNYSEALLGHRGAVHERAGGPLRRASRARHRRRRQGRGGHDPGPGTEPGLRGHASS